MASSAESIYPNLIPSSPIDGWACSFCSFHNPVGIFPCCEMCGSDNSKSGDEPLIPEQPEPIWICPKCTLHNPLNAERCNACNEAKPSMKPMEGRAFEKFLLTGKTRSSLTVRVHQKEHEQKAEVTYENIIKYCKKQRSNFIDDQFPPTPRSIGCNSFTGFSQWLRIENVAASSGHDRRRSWKIFDSPQPTDIEQGALGNCWLMAALSLVSEKPELLQNIILTKTVNPEGVYLVRICHNGLWKTIIVDDLFPCTSHKKLVFTKAKRLQLYAPLIEKACAKLFGSYASLRSGHMREGLQLLTGAPCDNIDLVNRSQDCDNEFVWARLLSSCEAKLLIGAATGGTHASAQEYKNVGIHQNHAFSILAAHELLDNSNRFVLVRDPHSYSNYKENLIRDLVLNELRSVNSTGHSAGAFWISWSRFLYYFSSLNISTYNTEHHDVREKGRFTSSPTQQVTAYHFNVPKKTWIHISLIYHRSDRKASCYHTQSFVLCDIDQSTGVTTVGERKSILVSKSGGFAYRNELLEAGSYVIIPFSTDFWSNDNNQRDFTLVIQSVEPFDLTVINKPATFLADCLISSVIKNRNRISRNHYAKIYREQHKLPLIIIVVENSSPTDYLTVDITLRQAADIHHSRCAHTAVNTHDCIPPRYRQILLIIAWKRDASGSSNLSYEERHEHVRETSNAHPSIEIAKHDLHSPRPF